MDVSLDEYIVKKDVNFRVQISNATQGRGSWGRGRGRGRLGSQNAKQGFNKFQSKNKGNEVTPMSVTVTNNTVGFDARDKIANRKRPVDARDAIAAKAKSTDARIKIQKLQSKKGTASIGSINPTGDARTKIKAKQNARQPKVSVTGLENVQTAATITTGGGITRTINQGPGTADASGDFQVKRILTNQNKMVQLSGGSVQITRKLGGTQQANNGLTLTKSVSNPQTNFSGVHMNNTSGPVIQIQNEQYHSGQQVYHRQNIPQMDTVQGHMTPYNSYLTHVQSPVQTHMVPVQSHMIPVQSNMTPLQSHMTPIQSHYSYQQEYEDPELLEEYEEEEYVEDFDSRQWAGEPSFPFTEKTLTVKMPQFTVKNRPLRNMSSNSAALVNKISTVTSARPVVATKRKATVLASVSPAKPVSGPLRLSGGPLKLDGNKVGAAKQMAQTSSSDSIPVKRTKIVKPKNMADNEEAGPEDTVLSPLQGFRIMVSNLHIIVTQDDIIELFGAIGPMKRARLVKQGTAEVVYVQKEDAMKAVQKYNNRELDGQAMQVKLLTSAKAQVKAPPEVSMTASSAGPAVPKGGPLRLGQNVPKKISPQDQVDVNTLHRALFKTGGGGVTKPVTFTVKI